MGKKIYENFGLSIGSTTLIMIFAVISLVVFSLLAYKTAINEYELALKTSKELIGYYEADYKAVKIKNNIDKRLDSGKSVKYLITKSYRKNGKTYYEYSVKISGNKRLDIRLYRKGETLAVLKWKEVNLEKDEYKNKLKVIGGSM